MPANDACVLIVATTAPSAAVLAWIAQRYANRAIFAAYLGDEADNWPAGENWTRWTRGDLEDLDRLRSDFLAFLEAWPRQRFGGADAAGGKTFDERFRQADGYSIWWTGPGIARHPDHGVFVQMRDVWAIAAAIERSCCESMVLIGDDSDIAAIVAEKCREVNVAFAVPPGCATRATSAWEGSLKFLFASLASYLVSPWMSALRAFVCRHRVHYESESSQDRRRPAIVMTSLFPREFRLRGEKAEVAFWSEVSAELSRTTPDLRLRHLLHSTKDRLGELGVDRLHCHRAWPELRKLDGLAPLPTQTVGWRAWIGSAWPFLKTLVSYCRLERRRDFRDSFRFASCDVGPLYVPLLRKAIARTHKWSQTVAAFEASLRAVGDVRAVFVYGEFYPLGMPVIAAAHKLKITTIGVQHGTIFPMHLTYTPPQGQIEGTPTPDWFAAYGAYAKHILSDYGAYPAERILVTGAPRLDGLIAAEERLHVRRELQLPVDKRIVLLATQVYPWFASVARALFEAVRQHPQCLVCVKTHPNDKPLETYRRIAADMGAANVRFYADKFNELLAACDVLVGGSSTATLEAILAGRETICVNFSTEVDRYPYVAEGGSLGAASPAELQTALDLALDGSRHGDRNSDRRAFLERHVGPTVDAQAANTFANSVLRLIHESDRGNAPSAAPVACR